MQGYKAKDISDILQLNYNSIRQTIAILKEKFLEYFSLAEYLYLNRIKRLRFFRLKTVYVIHRKEC